MRRCCVCLEFGRASVVQVACQHFIPLRARHHTLSFAVHLDRPGELSEVVHKASGRKLGYGELAGDASALPTPPADQIKLKDASAFRYIGKGTTPIVDLFAGSAGIPAGAHPAPLLTRSWRSPCPFQRRTAERYKGGCDPALTLPCEMGPRVRIRFPPAERWYGAGGEEMAPSSL